MRRPGLGSAVLRGLLCLPMLFAAQLIPSIFVAIGGSERQHSDSDPVSRAEVWALTVVVVATLVLLPLGWWARRRWQTRVLTWPQRVTAGLQVLLGAFAVVLVGTFVFSGSSIDGPTIACAPIIVSVPFVTAWVLVRDSRTVSGPGLPLVEGRAAGENGLTSTALS